MSIDGVSTKNPAVALAIPPPFPLDPPNTTSNAKFAPTAFPQKYEDVPTHLWSEVAFNDGGNKAVDIPKRVVSIAFLNGTTNQRDKVKKYARDWRRAAPIIRYRYVDGLHGYVRVAFDDPEVNHPEWKVREQPAQRTVNSMVWSYVGRSNFAAFDTPENVHIGEITDAPARDTPLDEKKYIHHAFGHVLGLGFAGSLPSDDWQKAIVNTVAPKLGWVRGGLANAFTNAYFDAHLPSNDSVMAFGWNTDITWTDYFRMAELYPIRASQLLRFSIRDIVERSLSHENDLDLYVMAKEDGGLYTNRRSYEKSGPLANSKVTWSYWSDVFDDSPEDFPPFVVDFAVLDMSDRIEFIAAAKQTDKQDKKEATLFLKYKLKDTGAWTGWQQLMHSGKAQTGQKLKILEIDGGYEVIFIKGDNKLAHFSRKSGDVTLPKEYHPVPSDLPIIKIVAARVGPPTNPIKIYASTTSDLYCAELDKDTLTWALKSVNAEKIPKVKVDHAFGMAGTTENAFVITADGQLWHNKNLNGGWVDWNDGLPALPKNTVATAIAIGEASSVDKESRYLQVFVLDQNGVVYYNRVHEEGYWQPSDDVTDANGNPIATKDDNWIVGFVKAAPAKAIFTKRAKSGDLELFTVAKGGNGVPEDIIFRFGVGSSGFKGVPFEPYIWGDLTPEKSQ